MADKELTNCACQNVKVETGAQVGGGNSEYLGTGCNSTTSKKFAPGHDAKLKALLVKAGLNNWAVHVKEADGSVSKLGHLAAASLHNMAEHVEKGVKLAAERLAKKEKAAAAKTAEVAGAVSGG